MAECTIESGSVSDKGILSHNVYRGHIDVERPAIV